VKSPTILTQTISKLLLLIIVSMSAFAPMSQAALIGTPQLMNDSQAQQDRAYLITLLQRDELATQLTQAGVDMSQLQSRIATLTHEEVNTLTEQLDELPAGSGILGTALIVFLVLLATDILGYTEVFPFVKKTLK